MAQGQAIDTGAPAQAGCGARRAKARRRDTSAATARARNQSVDSRTVRDDRHAAPNVKPSDVFMQGGWGLPEDACAYLGGLSRSTLRREIRRGRLRAYKVGGRKLLRLKRADCDAYMESEAIAVPVK
jgi:excisionase family DNA binding protein